MINILEDVSKLTTIPEEALKKLNSKYSLAISYALDECLKSNSMPAELNIGLGKLIIEDAEDEVLYKFIPSDEFEECVLSVVRDGKNPLRKALEQKFVSQILNTYKDIL